MNSSTYLRRLPLRVLGKLDKGRGVRRQTNRGRKGPEERREEEWGTGHLLSEEERGRRGGVTVDKKITTVFYSTKQPGVVLFRVRYDRKKDYASVSRQNNHTKGVGQKGKESLGWERGRGQSTPRT